MGILRWRLMLAVACAAPGTGAAQFLDGWLVSATNTLRLERYDASGDPAGSPYSRLGTFSYDEFTLTATTRPTPYSQRRIFVTGVVNDSAYRSSYRGFVPEKISVLAESGDHPLAWRAELGDLFAFTTLRTLQRSLKGASLELQPEGSPALRQSVLLFAGAVAREGWRDPRWSDDNSIGASWLVDTSRYGKWNANVVRSSRDNDASGERAQTVASVAGESVVALGSWKLRAEGELARLHGDHDGARDARDTGAFAQVALYDGLFNARLRGERYGRDYRPFGGVTPADRRSVEAHAGWNLPAGLAITARVQEYRDGYEGTNPTDTRVVGGNVSGSLAALRLSGTVDAFVQETEDASGAQDSRLGLVSVDVSRAFGPWVGRVAASLQRFDDHLDDARSYRTTQAAVSAIVPFTVQGLRGTLSPGVRYRRTTGANALREWQPTAAIVLAGGAHQLTASFGRQELEPRAGAFTEVATINAAVDYRFRWGQHTFGVDATFFDRRPEPGPSTEAYRVGLTWSWHFERPPTAARVLGARAFTAPPVPDTLPRSPGLLGRIAPGQEIDATRRALRASGFGAGIAGPRVDVYEARLLEDVEQRQRLVLAHAAGLVERAVLVISLEGTADPARVYERVRRALLDAHGASAVTHEEGAWGPAFARELAGGRFIRISEWSTPYGVLRLGIPRRLDGTARIEIHHARGFGSPRDTLWGVDEVR